MLLEERVEALEKILMNNTVDICIEVSDEKSLPVYAFPTDAGADLIANEDIVIKAGETKIVPTGIKVAIPKGFELQVRPRSGVSAKTGLRVANAPGTVDAGYRDTVGVIISNVTLPINGQFHPSTKFLNLPFCGIDGKMVEGKYDEGDIVIRKGDRIAQMVIAKVYHANFIPVENVKEIGDNRGGGFGHSGFQRN